MTMPTLGILGVGHLATYTVTGLRNGGDQRRIILSPRNAEAASRLAGQCRCDIAGSNQAVVEGSDIILLAVRPQSLSTLLRGLTFKPGQLVISAMAGVSLQQLRQYSGLQATTLVRALPPASVEVGAGPVPLFPANAAAETLFGTMGKVIVLESEALFNVALAHGCLHGWSYFLVQQLIDWSMDQGMSKEAARQMVVHSISSAMALAESRPDLDYGDIGKAIATPGTFTLKGLEHIKAGNGLQAWSDAMDAVSKEK
ncbi:pyrroline-5-carboxylate reductase [Oceanimonas sp. GK1]|uniref:NAD(P)-binding domain-containing protein n=1 Tax=Oceanimonas sp. (strain GK1 / IBRC-M 10197) TaxID=511062 RepID=UPI00024950C5|nr:NAD(P)-binding domain-containing protein [Oceanimonas sp. GK1]AEY01338.1 pyrroline-5-carboxylate reductase [Oceanimonas sp. GK1]